MLVRIVRSRLALLKEKLFLVINLIIKLTKILKLKLIKTIILPVNKKIKICKVIKFNKTNLNIH